MNSQYDDGESLGDRHKSWYRRLIWTPRSTQTSVPFIAQHSMTDCSAACLAMSLSYFGRHSGIEEVRNVLGVESRDGTTASQLIRAARYFGLRGYGASVEASDIGYVPRGAILHWDFNHFLVYQGTSARGVEVCDPAVGRRTIPHEEFDRLFTGIVVILEPDVQFARRPRQTDAMRRMMTRVLRDPRALMRIVMLSAIVQCVGVGVPLLTGVILDKAIPYADLSVLWVCAIGFLILAAYSGVVQFSRSLLLLYLRTEIDTKMASDFLSHMLALPYSFFQSRSTGDLVMRLASNGRVRDIITSGAMSASLDGVLVLSYLAVLFAKSWLFGALSLLLGVVQVVIFVSFRRNLRELTKQDLQARATMSGLETQTIGAIQTVKAIGLEAIVWDQWARCYADVLNISLKRGRLDALAQALISTMAMASPVLLLAAAAALTIRGDFSIGTMMAMVALAAGFLAPLSSLVGAAFQFQELGGYVGRIEDIYSHPVEQDLEVVHQPGRLSGAIALEDVSFRYSTIAADVLSNISLQVDPGELVVIVGKTGCGKSTLAHLLLGLYLPSAGVIRYDGRDIRSLDLRGIRSQVGVVVQRVNLFGGSIRDNIAMARPDSTLAEVERAARLAQIHDEIVAMNLGYETPLVDGGSSLSGGQAQRIAIARALLTEPKILLLDEATSALDAITEKSVADAIGGLGCTRICITHRLRSLKLADRIVVLDHGRVLACGRHDELVRSCGHYCDLVADLED